MVNKKSNPKTASQNGEQSTNAAEQPSELMQLFDAKLKAVQLNGKASTRATPKRIRNVIPQTLIDALTSGLAGIEN